MSPKYCEFDYITRGNRKIRIINLQFLNVIYFKLYSREHVCFKTIIDYCKKFKQYKFIHLIIYSCHLPFLRAAIHAKKYFNNIRIELIITDLPEFKNDNMPKWKEWLYSYDTHINDKIYKNIDGFILLTEKMSNKVIFHNQPYEIIEGIYNLSDRIEPSSINFKSPKKIIFYSGTLARRYNIMSLVEAFMMLNDDNYELMICGSGSCEEEIKRKSEIDKRIIFKGALLRSEVLKLQSQATLLVNPRTNEGEYTMYSFPSKTMEYLGSGVPTLLYKLSGIPSEYYKYCFTLSDSSVNSLAKKIDFILKLPDDQLKEMGQKAKDFIINNKNCEKQCKRFITLLNNVENL